MKFVSDVDEALQCIECTLWYHIQCQNVSLIRYNKIIELNRLTDVDEAPDGIEWRCDKCRVIKQEFGTINRKITNLESKTKEELLTIQQEISVLKSSVKDEVKQDLTEELKILEDKINRNVMEHMLTEIKRIETSLKTQLEESHNAFEVKISELVTAVEGIKVKNEEKRATEIVDRAVTEKNIEDKISQDVKKKMQTEIKRMENSLKIQLEESHKNFEDKNSELVTTVEGIRMITEEKKVTDIVDQAVTEKLKEEEDRKLRSNRFIVFGIVEEEGIESAERVEHDKKLITELLTSLKVHDKGIQSFTRLGKKKETGNRPLLITATDDRVKWQVISRAKMLRDMEDKWKGVYIVPDLTINERKTEAVLRATLREKRDESSKNLDGRRWTIKKGKVIATEVTILQH